MFIHIRKADIYNYWQYPFCTLIPNIAIFPHQVLFPLADLLLSTLA